eukprot:TRINITY_DN2373_c0_g1_i2.p1 TRINITY_DN2373_c0_g1~~TRINITY_DN2373_c0_g1_i2.p1  ORF type:complete len:307 (-),score=20.28 TRINITY_DN2373_c0_g1_i2:256-1176(-)
MVLINKIISLTSRPNFAKFQHPYYSSVFSQLSQKHEGSPYSSTSSSQTPENAKISGSSLNVAYQKYLAKKSQELGLVVKPVTKETSNEALEFLWKHFVPSEPISRSLRLTRGWWVDQIRFRPLIESGVCLAGYSSQDGRLLAVAAGRVLHRTDRLTRLRDQLGKYGYIYILPLVGSAVKSRRFVQARSLIGFDPWAFMEERNIGKVFEGGILAVHNDHLGRGIGELLIYHLFPGLQARGCQATYDVYSSKYSAPIIDRMGDFEVLALKKFSELVDDKGELLFPDADADNALSVRTRKLKIPPIVKA